MRTFRLAALLALASFLLAVSLSMTSCGTTPETKIAQGAQIVITGVNDAMSEWANYVNQGKATQKQIDTVKLAYNGYYDAVQVVRALAEKMAAKQPGATAADLATANTAMVNAETSLLNAVSLILHAVIKTA